jgi:hypothetical protein
MRVRGLFEFNQINHVRFCLISNECESIIIYGKEEIVTV